MTSERFHTLVEAYGADPRRWPGHERAEALAWARAHRAEADAALEQALALDAWLARDMVAPPSRAFVEQVIAGAPIAVPAHDAPSKRRLFWWSGAAFAGAGLAGALAGALTMSLLLLGNPEPAASHGGHETAHESPSWMSTSFGGSIDDWGNE
jgi:hypothetical protein